MSHSLEHYTSDKQNAVKGSEVFVGGLPRTITEDRLREIFSTCGEILEIRLIKDQKGCLKGFCFVRFSTKAAADKAVREKSGLLLDGKKIGVLPSVEQDTLFMGNLYKGWTADEFNILVRQVFPDVVSVDLATPFSTGETPPGQKKQNRGFAFVKFSSHAAAARAHRAGSSPEFVLAGKVHPAVDWAEEDPEVDPEELAKVKIAFIRNLPAGTDEDYLKKLFIPIGKVDKAIVSNKTRSPVGFIHFSDRSELDDAIKEMNGKTVQGPNGGPPFKLLVEVARPMEKSKKRARDDPQSNQPSKVPTHSKVVTSDLASNAFTTFKATTQQEAVPVDPYEDAVVKLPVAVKERLLRILRLGIATRFDIDIECLTSLKELSESTAISVLDQFMLSGADKNNKGAYLTGLISKHQVDKLGRYGLPSSLSRANDMSTKDLEMSSFSSRAQLPAFDSISSHVDLTTTRSDGFASRYSYMYSDYPLSSRPPYGRLQEANPSSDYPLSSRAPYGRLQEANPRSDYPLSSRAPYGRLPEANRSSDYPLSSRAPYGRLQDANPSSDYPTSTRTPYDRLQEANPSLLHLMPQQSTPYGKVGQESHVMTPANRPTRPQMKFDPFTGEPYKFDPFTGEPIRPESPQRHFRSPH